VLLLAASERRAPPGGGGGAAAAGLGKLTGSMQRQVKLLKASGWQHVLVAAEEVPLGDAGECVVFVAGLLRKHGLCE
jgi:hypothetical protein